MTSINEDFLKTEKAAKALGEELLDQIHTRWYEYSEQGMRFEDHFMQTVRDVINGEYFG